LPAVLAPAAEFYPSIARDAAGGSQNIAQLLPAATSSGTAAAAGSGSFIGWPVLQQQQLEGAGSHLQPSTPVQSQSPAAVAAAPGMLPLQQQQQQQMYPGLGSIPSQIMLMPGMPAQQSVQIPAGWLQPLQPEQQQDGQPSQQQQQQQLPFGMTLQQQGGLQQQRSSRVAQPQDQQQQQQQQQIPKLLGGLSLDDQICMHLQQQKQPPPPQQQQQQSDQASEQDVTPQQQHPDQQQRSSPDSHQQQQQQQQLLRPPHPLNARSFLRRNTTLWAREIMDSRCNVDMAMLEFDPGGCLGWSAGLDTHIATLCVRNHGQQVQRGHGYAGV
jgi:hypothetical protein